MRLPDVRGRHKAIAQQAGKLAGREEKLKPSETHRVVLHRLGRRPHQEHR